MNAAEHVPDRPDLAVIDRAIELVRTGVYHGWYSCWALSDCCINYDNEYTRQYTRWIKESKGRLPDWWGGEALRHTGARINALKSFRQACVDAGAVQAPGATHGGAA